MLAMLGLGGSEIILILLALVIGPLFIIGVVFLVVWLVRRSDRKSSPPPAPTTATRRFCHNCGQEMAADAPQGLCAACLMKVALGSEGGNPAGAGQREPAPASADIARHFPQLEILELLGQGGMGMVYKARQRQLDRLVALKILPANSARDPAFAERFSREARALARLNHPNIVSVYDFGLTRGSQGKGADDPSGPGNPPPHVGGEAAEEDFYYFIMEYVDGVNLRQLEHTRRLAPSEALTIVPRICDALQYAHDEGIVHRDIKPENILIDKKGRVKIADFGLAKLLGQAPKDFRLTDADRIMGTPHYMAPEQVEHPLDVDHRADIYSLGVVFYEMLTGELPLGKFAAPSHKVQMDVRLDEVVLKSLEKEPERRYQQVSEVKTQVETIAGSVRSEAGSQKSGASHPAPIKSERGRLGLQESPGAAVSYPSMGELALHTDGLMITSGYQQRTIPLTDIRGLGEAVMPWWFSPAGHCYAGVDFDQGGQRRKLAFLPGTSYFRTVPDSRSHSAEWLTAIQHAVKSATGAELAICHTPVVMPVKSPWSWFWLLLPVIFGALLVGKLLSGGGNANASAMWIFLPLSPLLILLPILAWRLWSVNGRASSAVTNQEPRFSRTAIVGACWAPFFFITALLYFTGRAMPTGQSHGPSWGQILMTLTILPLGFTAPFGTTILGWIAVAQIRRSAGKLYGLGLAVFDGLFFPLLMLDALIAGGSALALRILGMQMAARAQAGEVVSPVWYAYWLLPLSALALIILTNFLIARWVWHAVKKPLNGDEPGKVDGGNVPAQKPREDRFWKRFAVVIVLGVAALILIPVAAVLLAIILPARERAHQQSTQRNVITELTFGPVIERVIPDPVAGIPCVLDFETGNLLQPPTEIIRALANDVATVDPAVVRWLRDNGGDAVVAADGSIQLFEGVVFNPTIKGQAATWDELTPSLVAAGIGGMAEEERKAAVHQPAFHLVTLRFPAAMEFTTRERSMGVIQILGASDHPRGVKLRYKLVQNTQPAVSQPQMTQRQFVNLIVGKDRLVFEGKPVAGDSSASRLRQLEERLGKIPEPRSTEIAFWRAADLPQKEFYAATVAVGKLAKQLGFADVSVVSLPRPSLPTEPGTRFGPVIERVVQSAAESTNDYFLDLDTGKFLEAPDDIRSWMATRFQPIGKPANLDDQIGEWARSVGADFTVPKFNDQGAPLLILYGGLTSMVGQAPYEQPTSGDPFEKLTTGDVLREVRETVELQKLSGKSQPPYVGHFSIPDRPFIFQTREGGIGVLQVLGQTKNRRGVKIRYKLVLPPTSRSDTGR